MSDSTSSQYRSELRFCSRACVRLRERSTARCRSDSRRLRSSCISCRNSCSSCARLWRIFIAMVPEPTSPGASSYVEVTASVDRLALVDLDEPQIVLGDLRGRILARQVLAEPALQ